MGSHVSAVPNHQVFRVTPLKTRADVAYFGTFGYELDVNKIPPEEQEEIRGQIAFFKEHYYLIAHGTFYRLVSPYGANPVGLQEGAETAWSSPPTAPARWSATTAPPAGLGAIARCASRASTRARGEIRDTVTACRRSTARRSGATDEPRLRRLGLGLRPVDHVDSPGDTVAPVQSPPADGALTMRGAARGGARHRRTAVRMCRRR
ncbi:MAG: alpha-galactosidase [Bifidobacterium breve]